MRFLLVACALITAIVPAAAQSSAETAIREALSKWTRDFNAKDTNAVCDLFASELRFDFRTQPERGFNEMCAQLRRSLTDTTRTYSYSPRIKEVIVSGDLAAVWLVWTLKVSSGAGEVVSEESSMDIFRKQPDGSWKIIRFLAYEN